MTDAVLQLEINKETAINIQAFLKWDGSCLANSLPKSLKVAMLTDRQ